jgi:uncharacterized membrane protein (DUF4010 family)
MIVVNLLTVVAMFARNLALLLIFSAQAGIWAGPSIAVMVICTTVFIWWQRPGEVVLPDLKLGSPISLRQISVFGGTLLLIQVIGSLGQRMFGQSGAIAVNALGGLISSASSTAAVANLSAHGEVTPFTAALAAIVASAASALVNLPILYRRTQDQRVMSRLLGISVAVIGAGIIAFAVTRFFRQP